MLLLAACGSGTPSAPPAYSPDSDATRSAVDALCKLFEGADKTCARETGRVVADGHEIGVSAELQPVVTEYGTATLRGIVHVEGPDGRYSSRLRGFGGNKREALERGSHEWALVSGVALADLWLGPTRPALAAVEEGFTPAPLGFAGSPVVRGWPLYRPAGELDHAKLLEALEPAFADRAPHGMLSLELTRQSGEVSVECWFQGEVDDQMCEAAKAWSWPGGEYELRLAYAVQKSG